MAMEAVVLFDYEKMQDDEIDLKLGEIIQDVKQADEGWCEGTLNGVRGMFPDNFVKLRPAGSAGPSTKAIDGPPTVPPQATPLVGGGPPPSHSSKKSWRARVTYSYAAENADEINLTPGEVVEVVAEEEEGWWRGRVRGKEGLFPSNFVASIPDGESAGSKQADSSNRDPSAAPPKPPATESPAAGARQSMLGPKLMLGDFNPLKAKENLKKTGRPAPAIPSKEEPRKPSLGGRPPALPPSSEKQVEKAKVLYDYAAEEPDELSIHSGNIVEVVKKDAQEGWWEVRLDGKVGLVPDNFIEPLSSPPPKKPDPPHPYNQPPKKPAAEVKRPPPPSQARPDKPPPPKPADETDDSFGVPSTTPLDSSAVKNRAKNAMGRRPPSRVNLPDATDETPPPIPPAPVAEEHKAPWQLELKKKRALSKPVLPKPTAALRPAKPAPSLPKSQSPPPDRPKPPPAKLAAAKPAAPPPTKPAAQPPTKPAALPPTKPAALPPKSQEAKPPAAPPPSVTPPVTVTPIEPHPAPVPPSPKVDREWKEAFERLRAEFEQFKADCLKDIEILTKDLDEERKIRGAMEVDIDRLKKTRGFRDVL